MAGIGRGRGWLNLKTEVNHGENTDYSHLPPKNFSSLVLESPSSSTDRYKNILTELYLFNENDDEQKMTMRANSIKSVFKKECSTAEDVIEAYKYIHEKCLNDERLIKKFVHFMTFKTIWNKFYHNDIEIRKLFINQCQQDYENAKELKKTNISAFKNLTTLLCLLCLLPSGGRRVFKEPAVKCLEMLLDINGQENIKQFTEQLYLIGSEISENNLENVLLKIRSMLAYNSADSKSKLWLLLALDISVNKFCTPSPEILNFYKDHLGEKELVAFQVPKLIPTPSQVVIGRPILGSTHKS